MRILLAAKHAPHGPQPIGGVQTWCRTVCSELESRGFDVETWGPDQPDPVGEFDIGFVANVGDTGKVLKQCGRVVVISHGIIPAENPHQVQEHRGPIVFTSEEVHDHWDGVGVVVRQPIDTTFWSPGNDEKRFLTRFSYRQGLRFVMATARSMNLEYCHLRNNDSRTVREMIRRSVCVLATGRAALEAMSCGVPVVICDHRGSYQGPLMDLDVTGAAKRNYSGRGGVTPTPELVLGAVKMSIAGGSMRRYIEENHSVVDIVDQLMDIATLRRGTL